MTPQEIDNMQAGRELDALVSEKVMGIKWPGVFWDGDPDSHFFNRRAYSTDIAAAWQVVEKLKERGFGFWLTASGDCWFEDSNGWRITSKADGSNSVPLAICRAALEAVAPQEDK